jgi:hypothetical protein
MGEQSLSFRGSAMSGLLLETCRQISMLDRQGIHFAETGMALAYDRSVYHRLSSKC